MKILFDHQIFEEQNFGGISRYFYEILNSLDNDINFDYDLSLTNSDNLYIKRLSKSENILSKVPLNNTYESFLSNYNFRGKGFVFKMWTKLLNRPITDPNQELNKTTSIKKLKAGNFDIFHPTYYDDYFLDHIGNKPFVLTVHDLIHQIFPEFGMYELKDKNQKLIDSASSIITVSENTKKDLITLFNVDETKINVIHLANSLVESPTIVNPDFCNQVPKKYLLFVGGRNIYKNFLFFVQVFSSIKEVSKNISIVCTGSGFTKNELFFFEKLGVKGSLKHISANDDQLVYLYKNAIALVYPSMYEGFGLPVLEAFAFNCPVAMSNTSSLSEIGEDAVIYFDPKNPTSMKNALKTILENTFDQERLSKKSRMVLQNFSWMRTTEKTKTIYQQVLNHN